MCIEAKGKKEEGACLDQGSLLANDVATTQGKEISTFARLDLNVQEKFSLSLFRPSTSYIKQLWPITLNLDLVNVSVLRSNILMRYPASAL